MNEANYAYYSGMIIGAVTGFGIGLIVATADIIKNKNHKKLEDKIKDKESPFKYNLYKNPTNLK